MDVVFKDRSGNEIYRENKDILEMFVINKRIDKSITESSYVVHAGIKYKFKGYNEDESEAYFQEMNEVDNEVDKVISDLQESGIIRIEKKEIKSYFSEGSFWLQHLSDGDIPVRKLKEKITIEKQVSVKKPSLEQLKQGYVLTTSGSIKFVPKSGYSERKLKRIYRNGRWFKSKPLAEKKQKQESLLGKIKIIRELLNDGWEEEYSTGYLINTATTNEKLGAYRSFGRVEFNELGLYKDAVAARVVIELFEDEIRKYLI